MNIDNETFAIIAVSLFLQIVGILRMPHFLGPTFNPFTALVALLELIVKNTLWISVVPAVSRTSIDNKTSGHSSKGVRDALVETAAKAREPTEYSISTVTIAKMTPDAATVNETLDSSDENVKRETAPATRKWQTWVRKER
jgi:hypothetical protein